MRRYRLFVTVLALAALALLAGCRGSDPEAPNPPAARTRQPKLEIELETMRGVDHTGALAYTPTYAESALQWIQQRWPSR